MYLSSSHSINERAEKTTPAKLSASEQNLLYRPTLQSSSLGRYSVFCSLALKLAGIVLSARLLTFMNLLHSFFMRFGEVMQSENQKLRGKITDIKTRESGFKSTLKQICKFFSY
jgi:hypothetical protein